jgi:hypothetical protein
MLLSGAEWPALARAWARRDYVSFRADTYYESEEGAVPDDDDYRRLRARLALSDPVPVGPVADYDRVRPLDDSER